MKLRFFLALFGAIVLAQTTAPVMALQCASKPTDLVVKARAAQTVESNMLDCMLEGEAAIHLTGKLISSLVRARGYIEIRFFDQNGKRLWVSRQGPWLGTFSGLALDESLAVPLTATRFHVVTQSVSAYKEAAGEFRITALSVSLGIVVTEATTKDTVITTRQSARWLFSTVPTKAQGKFQIELRDQAGQIKEVRTVQKSEVQTEIDLGKLPIGYYQLRVRFASECAHAGTWRTALVVLPDDKLPNESRFGIDAALSWYREGKEEAVKRSVKMMRQAGIGAVRDRMSWSQIQPVRQHLNWERFEEVAKIVAKAKMEPVQVFHDSPGWTRPGGSPQTNQQAPDDNTAVFEFGQAYAKGLGKTVRSVEYWNEQNSGFFRGYPFQYSNNLKAFYAGIKSIDPSIRVLIGAAAKQPGRFFEEIYHNNAANFFDTRNLHYYGEINELDSFLDKHLAPMERNAGVASRPGWITEIGYSLRRDVHGNWETAEREQAEYLVKAYTGGFAAGYERVFFFFWGEIVETDFHTWGIVREDFSPRPAYLALALLTRHLAKAYVIASERHGTGRTIYFRRDDGSLIAVTWGGGASVNRLGANVEIHSIFGQQLNNASAEMSSLAPLLLSRIERLPEQAKRINLPEWTLGGSPFLWLDTHARINDKSLVYLSGNKVAASIGTGKIIEIAARAHMTASKTGKTIIDCLSGPGLTLLSPTQITIEHPKLDGESFTCRFQANLTAVGESYVTVKAKNEKNNDTIRIALIPDATFDGTTGTAIRPLMPNGVCPRWIPSHSTNLDLTIEPVRDTLETCPVTATSRINKSGSSWVFPTILLPHNELDTAIGLHLRIDKISGWAFPPTLLRLQLIEKNGEIWIVDLQNKANSKVYLGLFVLAKLAPWGRDDNGRLDIVNVQRILVGWGGHNGIVGQRYGFTIEAIDILKESP